MPPFATVIAVPFHIPLVIVPTPVKLEPVTVAFNVVPFKVPASAVVGIVISPVPSKSTLLIFLAVASFVAVAALPVTFVWSPVFMFVVLLIVVA